MASCTMCGVTVPDGQSCCSMCYGDVDFGSDGYYLAWLERELQKQAEEKRDKAKEVLGDDQNTPLD